MKVRNAKSNGIIPINITVSTHEESQCQLLQIILQFLFRPPMVTQSSVDTAYSTLCELQRVIMPVSY